MVAERATKKQQELLQFIDGFIKGNGYGPSYREVMRALGYKSVSTVAIHIDRLIAKGYLEKKDNSARSLTVVSLRSGDTAVKPEKDEVTKRIEAKIVELEADDRLDDATILKKALDILQ